MSQVSKRNLGKDFENEVYSVFWHTIAKITAKIDSPGFKIFFKKLEQDTKWKKFWEDIAKTYLLITHPDKYARLGDEGIERIYLGKRKRSVLR